MGTRESTEDSRSAARLSTARGAAFLCAVRRGAPAIAGGAAPEAVEHGPSNTKNKCRVLLDFRLMLI